MCDAGALRYEPGKNLALGSRMQVSHQLSNAFMKDLLGGTLSPLLREVKEDDTLLLGLRGAYISVYYRGGQLLKITPGGDGYNVTFDRNYDSTNVLQERLTRYGCPDVLDRGIRSSEDTSQLVDVLSELKRLMDRHAKVQSGLEREFQQVAARVNTRTKSSNSSHYFITDIEHAYGKARYDMLGVRWRRNVEHRDHKCLVPVIFEVKYGLDALEGTSGVLGHLEKTLADLQDETFRRGLRENVIAQFSQLSELGLIKYERGRSKDLFEAVDGHVQIVFLLAEYVPHSIKLAGILDECDRLMASSAEAFEAAGLNVELLFASASLCGYGMHERTMLTTSKVRELVRTWNA